MHLADPIFIFILALVLLGPKKTGELAHQLGKLMAEFRKASNDFKFQFNEEMRVAEQQERQKKQDEERAAIDAKLPKPELASGAEAMMPLASTGETAGTETPATASEAATPSASEYSSDATTDATTGATTPATPVEAVPYAVSAISATTGEEHPVEDHPLLRVDVIPPMDGAPADQTAATAVTGREGDHA